MSGLGRGHASKEAWALTTAVAAAKGLGSGKRTAAVAPGKGKGSDKEAAAVAPAQEVLKQKPKPTPKAQDLLTTEQMNDKLASLKKKLNDKREKSAAVAASGAPTEVAAEDRPSALAAAEVESSDGSKEGSEEEGKTSTDGEKEGQEEESEEEEEKDERTLAMAAGKRWVAKQEKQRGAGSSSSSTSRSRSRRRRRRSRRSGGSRSSGRTRPGKRSTRRSRSRRRRRRSSRSGGSRRRLELKPREEQRAFVPHVATRESGNVWRVTPLGGQPAVAGSAAEENSQCRAPANLVVGQFVVSPKAGIERLTELVEATPCHVLAVMFEADHADDARENDFRSAVADSERWHSQWFTGGGLLTLSARCGAADWVASTNDESHIMYTFLIPVIGGRFNPPTSVAVSVLSKMRATKEDAVAAGLAAHVLSDDFVGMVADVAERQKVRFLMGVFSGDQAGMAKLCKMCGIESRPYCQVWRLPHPVEEEDTAVAAEAGDEEPEEKAAVAAELEQEEGGVDWNDQEQQKQGEEEQEEPAAGAAEACFFEEQAQHEAVFPAYVLVRGPCARHLHALPENAPAWPLWLCRDGRFAKRLVPLSRVPGVDQVPLMPTGRSCGQGLPDLAVVKQKVADLQRWIPGVHQVVLWVGVARQGCGAREAHQQKLAVEKGAGKGRGAKGKRGKKGNKGKKGKGW